MATTLLYRRFKGFAKLALGLAIVAYLLQQAQGHGQFERILREQKDWALLAASLGCVVAAVGLGFLRWFLLVRAAQLPFTLGDAVRLGSLGFALNFVAPGGVGGDLFKAVALAKEHAERKSQAVATVVADRLIGLTSLLGVSSMAILITGMPWNAEMPPGIRWLAWMTIAVFTTAVMVGSLLMAPGRVATTTAEVIHHLPVVGQVAGKLLRTCQMMSRRPDKLIPALGLGIAVHLLLVLSFHFVALGLPLDHPPLSQHLCIVPLAETAGAIPITPGGLGTTEAALAGLYEAVGHEKSSGVIVALGQRLVMLFAGIVAIGYYLTQRQSMDAAMHEAEQEA